MQSNPPSHAKIVWCKSTQPGRNAFCLFLRRLDLHQKPSSFALHLFADSLYRLRVNGEIVGFGPARFLPSNPQYDSYDLAPWLRQGTNTILVEVNHRGAPCFQAVEGKAGFIAWGGEASGIDLSTPGEWSVSKSSAWDADAEPYSFAQGPVEVLDTTKLAAGYPTFLGELGPDGWRPPIEVGAPDHWGKFSARAIAPPTLKIRAPKRIVLAAEVHGGKSRYGFAFKNVALRARRPLFTHIYAPKACVVELNVFWGPFFLNGENLAPKSCDRCGNRQIVELSLRAGWNFFYAIPLLMKPFWTWMMELPEGTGLLLKALPDADCDAAFGLGVEIEFQPEESMVKAPGLLKEVPGYPADWQLVPSDIESCSPARAMAWDMPGKVLMRNVEYSEGLTLPVEGEAIMLSLDMGDEFLGHVEVRFETGQGAVVDLGNEESLDEDGRLNFYRSNPYVNSSDRFVCAAGEQTVSAFHERGGRYVQLTFRGRPGWVKIHSVAVIDTTGEHRVVGDFKTGDAVFDWAWNTGINTLRVSMSDGWSDGPWRERGMYIGDVLISAPATRKFTDDWRMEPWAIRLWARGQCPNGQIPDVVPSSHQHPLSDYTLLWIVLVRNYWAATGDVDLVREMWPTVTRVLASSDWKEAEAGLWKVPEGGKIFLDWECHPEERLGVNGALNAFRFRALECAAELAKSIGLDSEAAELARKKNLVRVGFRKLFWNAKSGRFAASWINGRLSEAPSLHVNALVLAYGLGDEQQEAGVLSYLKRELPSNTQVRKGNLELYFLFFLLDGLYRVGEAGMAEEVIRQHYGVMKERGAWTFWETFRSGLHGKGSLCHGWACSPMIYFSERILGVREAVPGDVSQILVAPESDSLNAASGIVPHPMGLIQVSWRIEETKLLLSVVLPDGVAAIIQPSGRLAKLELVRVGSTEAASAVRQPNLACPV